jgi:hypothetical protein
MFVLGTIIRCTQIISLNVPRHQIIRESLSKTRSLTSKVTKDQNTIHPSPRVPVAQLCVTPRILELNFFSFLHSLNSSVTLSFSFPLAKP